MNVLRALAIVTLLLLGLGALAGGAWLIADPSGSSMRMPLSFLHHSPFHSFFYPGMILFLANGVLPLVIAAPALRRTARYGWWIVFQGCVLLGWITAEVIMLRAVAWPHYLYWGWGLLLVGLGLALRNDARAA